jgi:hypothetical protein
MVIVTRRKPLRKSVSFLLYGEFSVEVQREYHEGGRWSNYESTVFKVTEVTDEYTAEVAYFKIFEEVPATESQDGGDFMFEMNEVVPYQVVETKYRKI